MNNQLSINQIATSLKEGTIVPFGIKKDTDGIENFVFLLKENKKNAKKIKKSIKNIKMYRIVIPFYIKEERNEIALFLFDFGNNELKYFTYLFFNKEDNGFFEKSLLLERITLVISDGEILIPYYIGGIPYPKEIKYKKEISKKDQLLVSSLLSAIGAEKLINQVDDMYNTGKVFGEYLRLDGLEIAK